MALKITNHFLPTLQKREKHIRSTPSTHSTKREQLEEPGQILLRRFIRGRRSRADQFGGGHSHDVIAQKRDIDLVGRLRREHKEIVLLDRLTEIAARPFSLQGHRAASDTPAFPESFFHSVGLSFVLLESFQGGIEMGLKPLVKRAGLVTLEPAENHHFAGPAMDVIVVGRQLVRCGKA